MKALILFFLFFPIAVKACSPPLDGRDFTCPPFDVNLNEIVVDSPKKHFAKERIYKQNFNLKAQKLIRKIKIYQIKQNLKLVEKMIDKALMDYENHI